MADVPTEVPAPTPVKPGWKTSEFWLTALASILGVVLGSGLIPDTGVWVQITGIVTTLLANLGYQVSRAKVKTA